MKSISNLIKKEDNRVAIGKLITGAMIFARLKLPLDANGQFFFANKIERGIIIDMILYDSSSNSDPLIQNGDRNKMRKISLNN